MQQLASIVLNHLEPGTTATEEVLRESVRELLLANEALFMQQIEPLTVYQMNMLRAIVSGIHSGYSETAVRRNFDLGDFRLFSVKTLAKVGKFLYLCHMKQYIENQG